MAAWQAYNRGLDEWRNWSTDTIRCLLLKGSGYTYNPDHDFVADVTPASNEWTVAGYARDSLSTKTRTIDDTNNRILYTADTLDFGSCATGEVFDGAVLYKFVTNDADSILLAYLLGDDRDSASSTPFTIAIPSGICYIAD